MAPRVSVLIPARDASRTIVSSLTSVAGQTLDDFEIVLVDDGSTDGTAELARAALRGDGRLRVLSPGEVGLVGALNIGLAECRADLVARFDADDLCRPERLERQTALIDSDPGLSIVSGGVSSFSDEGDIKEGYRLYDDWLNGLVRHEDIVREVFVESPLAHPSVLFKREDVVALGGYHDPPWPEDYDLWLRAAQAGLRFAKVSETVLDWRDHPGRASRVDGRYGPAAFLACKANYLLSGPLARNHEIVVWGAGKMGRRLSKLLAAGGVETKAFVDIDPRKIEGGRKATPPVITERELGAFRDYILLGAVGARGAREDIRRAAAACGWSEGHDFWCVA